MKQKNFYFAAALLAMGGIAAGCSGGSSPSALPSTPVGGGTASQVRSSASFSITVPSATKSGIRNPRYVSANTQSVSIVESDGTAAALAPVIANLTPGSPNCTTSGAGTTCTVSVPANPGQDSFTVTAFDAANGTGNKLSTGTVSATIVAGTANATTALVLGGIINSLTVILADPFAPIGTTTSASVQAKDASGAVIVGPFDNAVTLSSGSGATLAATSVSNSSDIVRITYTGESATPIAITATGDGKTATATLTPGSGIAYYNVGSNLTYNNGGFQIMTGADGKLYYSALGACVSSGGLCTTTTGALGQFDPATHTFKEYDDATSEVTGIYETSDGAVWGVEQTTTKILRFDPGTYPSGTPTEVAVANNYRPRMFSLGPDGNLWFVGYHGTIGKIDRSVPFSSSAITYYYVPSLNNRSANLNSGAWGPDGNLYVTDQSNGQVDKVSPSGTVLGRYTIPDQASAPAYNYISARFIVTGPDGNLYVTEGTNYLANPANGALYSMTTSGSFSRVAFPASAYQFEPDSITSNANGLAWADLANGSFGSLSFSGQTPGSVRELPTGDYITNQTSGHGIDGATFAPDGTPWFTCYGNANLPLCLGHVVLTNAWSVFPGRSVSIYGTGQMSSEYMGIGESGDSSPFTVTSANPAIATASHVSDHNFEIDGVAAGTTTLTITDKNGRAVTVIVNVTTTTGSVQSHMRKSGGII